MQAGSVVADASLQLQARDQRRRRIHHHQIDRARAGQLTRDFHALFRGCRLGEWYTLHVHAQASGPGRVEGMVGIDPSGRESVLLDARDTLDGECGLPAARRSKDLHHVATRKTAAQHPIQRAEARGEEGLRRARGSPHARQPQPDGPLPLLFLLHGN